MLTLEDLKLKTLIDLEKPPLTEYLVAREGFPKANEKKIFDVFMINKGRRKCEQHFHQEFKGTSETGSVEQVKPIFNNKLFIIEIVVPHRINRALVNLQFTILDSESMKTKRLKINLECTKFLDPIDF